MLISERLKRSVQKISHFLSIKLLTFELMFAIVRV